MNSLNACTNALVTLTSTSLRFGPKSNSAIENGKLLADAFSRLSTNDREKVLGLVKPDLGMKLIALSGFMAEAAINRNDVFLIEAAVVLHVIDGFREDCRENIRYLVLVAFAAKRLGVDLSNVAAPALLLASNRAKQALSEFLLRDDELNNLSSFAMSTDVVDGVFRFVPT